MKLSSNWRSSFKRGSVTTHHATKLSSYSTGGDTITSFLQDN